MRDMLAPFLESPIIPRKWDGDMRALGKLWYGVPGRRRS
jgi:hypothetical protein